MPIDGLSLDTTSVNSGAQLVPQQADQGLGKDAFMNLLVQQMKNQDPMNPQSNDQFIAQLASFSSLEQMQNMNDNLLTVALLQDNNALMSQLTTGSSLIGKQVTWTDQDTGVSQSGTVDSLKVKQGVSFLDIGGVEVPLQSISEVSEVDPLPEDGSESESNEDEI